MKVKTQDLVKIQNKTAIMQILGCILQNPSYLTDSNYSILPDDFAEKFHSILFSAMNNLYISETKVLDVPAICDYLIKFPSQYNVFDVNGGVDYIETVREIGEQENFDYNYKVLKKFTVLRDLAQNGVDITDLYDYKETDPKKIEKMNEELDQKSAEDIINHYMSKLNDVSTKFSMSNSDLKKVNVSSSVRNIIDSFKEKPDVGARLYNAWYNTAFRGARTSKFYLESASSGSGKTRRQLREATYLAMPYLYDTKTKEWVKSPFTPKKTVYIGTELEEDEVLPIMVAFLTGINEEKIKMNELNEEECLLVEQAISMLENNDNINIVLISDFDVDDIEKIIVDEILKNNCKYIFMDYLHSTPKSLSYYARKTGVKGLQEHQSLFLMSVKLKAICNKYKVFLWSSTQVNSEGMGSESPRNEQCLRGAKAIADKIDSGTVISRVTPKDIESLKEVIINNYGKKPTHCLSIYKNRGGRLRGVYLWSIFDLGTMREEFLYATTNNYEPIEVKILEIEEEIEEENETCVDLSDENMQEAIF